MSPRAGPGQAGFSLVELLVSLVIGLVLTLAITSMLVRSEGDKRNLHATNDMDQEASFTSFMLDRAIRNAGSGLKQSTLYGCPLYASRLGGVILPLAAALPAPFATMPLAVNLAPAVIFSGKASDGTTGTGDVIQFMSGSGGVSEAGLTVLPGTTAVNVRLNNTLGLRASDLFLLSQAGLGCMVEQIDSAASAALATSANQNVALGGAYYAAAIGGRAVTDYATAVSPQFLHLGDPSNRLPQFTWYGVGPNRTLYAYDLLNLNSTTPQAVAEGVVEMHALYGVDTDGNNSVDTYITPTVANGYDAATLLSGTPASIIALQSIKTLRIAMVLSEPLVEKDAIQGPSKVFTLFSDLPGANEIAVDLSADTQRRFRVVDFTVPLRSLL